MSARSGIRPALPGAVDPSDDPVRQAPRGRVLDKRDGARVQVDGTWLLNFCGNDHLGLSQHLEVVAALQESSAWAGVQTGVDSWTGVRPAVHRELEEAVAQWQGYPDGLLFDSPWLASLAVMQALLRPGDLCVQDKLNRPSLLEAARLAGADLRQYPHGMAEGAMRQLLRQPESGALVATDGVFALDGDLAPLKLLAVLARVENATLYVEDAHGTGLIGPDGRGSVAHLGLGPQEVPLQLVVLDGALGATGAVLVGEPGLLQTIRAALPFGYGDRLPPPLAAAARAAISVCREESWRRFKLAALVARFRRGAQQLGLSLVDSNTPIQSLLIGSAASALVAARQLEQAGCLVATVRPPRVPDGRARLRVSLNTQHEEANVDRLLEALDGVVRAIHDD